eukprot:CAMPEP_0114502526 /NCGR_PEP_ID=MMETSP0109-20121206/9147_1 /TAXON_ID=29199 /ORGANISM="Chlorarachnion reptans, Strain CCCM449" /LENGTH=214 /DNA_ID=CAMNT_0001680465 /DNA_START=284 /DNA_END=925 /DNA_ORIENTATION=-
MEAFARGDVTASSRAKVEEWYHRLIRRGFRPDLNAYHALLCSAHGKLADAERWQKKMEDDGVRPERETFDLIIDIAKNAETSAVTMSKSPVDFWIKKRNILFPTAVSTSTSVEGRPCKSEEVLNDQRIASVDVHKCEARRPNSESKQLKKERDLRKAEKARKKAERKQAGASRKHLVESLRKDTLARMEAVKAKKAAVPAGPGAQLPEKLLNSG